MVAMIRNSVGREHSSRAMRLSASIGVRRFARMECSWKMRSNLSINGYCRIVLDCRIEAPL